MKQLINFIQTLLRKKIVMIPLILLIGAFIYFSYFTGGKSGGVTYALETVRKGSIIVSVSGSGQVISSDKVEIQPKASGEIKSIAVQNGDSIAEGTVIAQIDSIQAQRAVRDAKINLESAQLTLEKLNQPSSVTDIKQAELALEQAKQDLIDLQEPPSEYDLLTADNAISQAERELQQAKDNKLKIESAVANAKAFIEVRKEFGTFDKYIWGFTGGKPINKGFRSLKELPARTELSDLISKDLKKRGFKFVGSTIVYAHMQATGMVNDHIRNCYRYKELIGRF